MHFSTLKFAQFPLGVNKEKLRIAKVYRVPLKVMKVQIVCVAGICKLPNGYEHG